MLIFFIIFLGLSFGSCASLLSYRLPLGENVLITRSKCPNCKNSLRLKNLFPVFSWAIQKGKCSFCNNKIHFRYPLIEITTALSFLGIFLIYGININAAILSMVAFLLIIACITDFEHYIVPDSIHIALAITGILWAWQNNYTIYNYLISPAIAICFGLIIKYGYIFIRNKDGLGTGDIKFFAIVAIFIGIENFPIFLLISGILGTIHGLVWQRITKSKIFPFIPALAIAFFFCLLIPNFFGTLWESDLILTNLLLSNF
jgi:leader peptidase (prepilin peptidase) / N-methyltransferase